MEDPQPSEYRSSSLTGNSGKRIREKIAQLPHLPVHEITALVRELETRCIELEKQNEELRANRWSPAAFPEKFKEEQNFRAVLEAATESILLLDREGTILVANRTLAERLGTTIEEMVGKNAFSFLPPEVVKTRKAALEEVFRSRKTVILEDRRGDVFLRSQIIPVFDTKGEVVHVVVFGRDITEQKVTDEALRRSEAKYRRLHQSIRDAFVSVDMQGYIQEFNEPYREMLGYAAEELPGLTYPDLTPEKWHAFEAEIVRTQILPRGYSDIYEKEYRRKDGTLFPVELRTFLIADEQGQPKQMWAIVRDISERKRVEEALRESEERLRLHVENSPLGVVEWGPDLQISRWSAGAERIFGWRAEEMLGKYILEVPWIHGEDKERVSRVIADLRDSTWPRNVTCNRDYRKDGSIAHIEWYSSSLFARTGELRSVLSMALDVTDRNRALEALSQSEERLQLAQANAKVGVWDWHPQTNQLFGSPEAEQLIGLAPGKMRTYEDWGKLVHPEDLARAETERDTAIARHEPFEQEYRIRHGSGDLRWISAKGKALYDEAGKVVRVTGIILDITERKKAEEALRNSEERLELALGAARMGTFDWDIVNDKVFWSPETERIWGLPEGGFEGTYAHWRKLVHPDDLPTAEARVQRALTEPDIPYEYEHRIVHPDGAARWIFAKATTVRNSSNQPIRMVGINMNITERKEAEAQLAALNETLEQRVLERTAEVQTRVSQLQHLAAQLTQVEERERHRLALVLHDNLQQLLVAAMVRLESAGKRAKNKHAAHEIAEAVLLVNEAIAESRSLTRELSPPVLYDVGLAHALEWLAAETKKKYQLPVAVQAVAEMEPEDLLTKVFVYHSVRELILNAIKHAHASSLKVSLARMEDDRLQVSVEDNGQGFDVKLLDRKHPGSGFGLFSIRERLAVNGGELIITSNPREGTKARIIVPCKRNGKANLPVGDAGS